MSKHFDLYPGAVKKYLFWNVFDDCHSLEK